MALDVGSAPKSGWLASKVERCNQSLWRDYVVVIARAGHDTRQLHRTHILDFWQSARSAEDQLALIQDDLEEYWSGPRNGDERTLVVPTNSPGGFDVALFVDENGIRGSFGGLTQEFETIAAAMSWVRRALSASYRLRTVSISGVPCEWRLEPSNGTSRGAGDTLESGHQAVWLGFLRTKAIDYRRNGLS